MSSLIRSANVLIVMILAQFNNQKTLRIAEAFRLLTNPVRRHRVCQIIQRLNLKQKGMRALRSAFRTNRGISPSSEVDLGLCPYLAPPSSKPHDLLKKVDQNFYAFCQHKTFVSTLNGRNLVPAVFFCYEYLLMISF